MNPFKGKAAKDKEKQEKHYDFVCMAKVMRMFNSMIKKCLLFIKPNYVLVSVNSGRFQQNAKQLNASFLLQNAFSFPQTKKIQDLNILKAILLRSHGG